ncbi:MAG: serine/threonine-protein kinase [Polyangiaceae bacterium]
MALMEVLADELSRGTVVADRYVLDRVVGEGGMGVVWAATHTVTGKTFALKFLRESKTSDPKSQGRLVREAKAACAVRHPAVATVLDVLELPSGAPFLVMDLLEGEPLTARLARGPLALDEARAIFAPVAEALVAAHEAGVVHRDLKPDNVFLARGADGDVEVKVLDFGIAKIATLTSGPRMTDTGDLVGTPLYMAPEVVFGELDVDGRADVWALGVMLYEALTGAPPTAAPTVGLTLKAITSGPLRPLSEAAPDVPRPLAALVDRMLTRAPGERPSPADVARALRDDDAHHDLPAPSEPRTKVSPSAERRGHVGRVGRVSLGLVLAFAGAGAVRLALPRRAEAPPIAIEDALPPTVTLAPASALRDELDASPPPAPATPKPSASLAPAAPRPAPRPSVSTVEPPSPNVAPTAGHDSGIIPSHDRK